MPKTVYNHHFAHSFCHLQRRESTTSPPVNILSENSCWLPIEPVRLPAELWDYNRRQQRNCSWGIIFSDSKQHIPWYPQSDFIIWLNDCHICIYWLRGNRHKNCLICAVPTLATPNGRNNKNNQTKSKSITKTWETKEATTDGMSIDLEAVPCMFKQRQEDGTEIAQLGLLIRPSTSTAVTALPAGSSKQVGNENIIGEKAKLCSKEGFIIGSSKNSID